MKQTQILNKPMPSGGEKIGEYNAIDLLKFFRLICNLVTFYLKVQDHVQ